MKRKLKSILAAALCAVGFTALALPPSPYRDIWSSTPDPQAVKDPTDVIDWGMASRTFESFEAKHGKFLEASADAMIAAYTARIEKDPTDCEALICRAFAYLKKAGENQTFFDIAQDFGYTFDNDTMHFTGELIQKKGVTPEMNDATAEVCDILLPLMKKAYADLSAVPDRWKGNMAITPDVYPVDEEIYFDWADVLCAKLGLAEMMCVLNMVKGFDVTMDSELLEYTFNSKSPKNGKRGVQPILENNPDFFSKVRDQKAATEAGDWWASAATLLDQWDKAHAKRSDGKQHFFDWNFEKMDDNTVQCYDWLHKHRDGLINLPYWASPFDYTLMNGDTVQFWTLQPLFAGKFLREHFPEFGVGVKEPWCNEPLLDTLPDSTLCGIYPGVSRTYIGELMTNVARAGDFTTIPPYTDDKSSSVHAIWYTNMFELGFANTGNPAIFAWDNATPITLLDPEFNVRGVTAVFTGWSFSGYTNGTTKATWEGDTIPTPFPKEHMFYKRRNVVATANFEIPKVTYLDFDGTSGKLVERIDECEIVKTDTTSFEAGKVYTVLGNVTIEKRITVSGTPANPTKLVLCDGATLMAMNGIDVSAGKALVICGQADGTGTLEATGSAGAAGIGGGGDVTINGGTVMAAGGSSGAGIGGGTVTINSGTVTASGSDGAAGIGGTVKFADGTAYGVAAGADEANAIYKTAAAYAADPSAAYVALPYFSLKIPAKTAGCSYEVSSMGVQPKAALADGTNTYAIATGATARVRFTPAADYVWAKEPEENPILIKNFSRDTVLGEGDLPTVKFVKKGTEGNPWTVGYSTRDSVAAWTNGTDKLVVEGAGDMEDFTEGNPAPWGTGIAEVEIGEDVTSIGARAFEDSKLESVTIPASVTSIGAAAFFGNTSLSCVAVEAMTPPALGEGAFVELAEGFKIAVPIGTSAAYKAAPDWSLYADHIVEGMPGAPTNPWTVGKTADDSVTAYTNGVGGLVVEGAGDMRDFAPPSDSAPWVTGVSEAEIGEGVTSIGAYAFNDSQLGSVTIPASVTNIGAAAFFGSTSLSNVVVEAMTPPTLGEGAFVEVAEGYRICVPHGTGAAYKAAPDWSLYADSIVEQGTPECPWEIGSPNAADLIAYMDGEGNLVIGGEGAMKGFTDAKPAPWGTNITSVTLGEGVTGIGAGAFKDCTSITKVTTDAVVPPTAADNPVFGSSELTEIHVPADAGEAYRTATGWSDYAGLIKEVLGCADRPWTLGEGVTAWVDEALTNLAAVVIDNGLPTATNAISLVALTNAFDRGGYEPAKRPLNALLKINEMDKATYVKPVSWFDPEGKAYLTLEAALEAGVTAVVPNFETKEAEIPQEIVETEQGEDGKTYLGIVENVSTNDVASPIKVIAAEGLTSMATNEQKNARLVVESKNESDVEPTVVQGLTNKLFKAEDEVDVKSANFVDLSVFYDKVQTNELESPIAIRIPWKVRDYATNRVARCHEGQSAQEIPEGEARQNVDGEYFEKGEDEIILHVKNFSDYALGESYVLPGSPRNPWPLGEGVTAVTNGTALVIGGEGTISSFAKADGLAELLPGLTAITITSNGVTDVAANMFQGVGTDDAPVLLTLPDGWQGELLDENGKWYGANAELTRIPLAVKKVKFAQRYPWNGLVDVGFTLTGPVGETNVVVMVKDGATEVTNFTETATIPAGGVLETNFVWGGMTAGLAANFKSDDVTVEVKIAASDIAAKSAAGTVDLRTAVALAEGETTISNVTWSATQWGEVPETFTTVGWTNLSTGAMGAFGNLSNIMGEGAKDAVLPQKDGDYVLTHSTGDLKSFATFTVSGTGNPVGSKSNPWVVGATAEDGVVAYTNGVGGVVIGGEGDMKDFTADDAPWGKGIASVSIGEDVTGLGTNAFTGCASLKDVTVLATVPPSMDGGAFEGCGNLKNIFVPKGTVSAYKSAPGWSEYARIISVMHDLVVLNADGSRATDSYYWDEKAAINVLTVTNNGLVVTGTTADERVVLLGTELTLKDLCIYTTNTTGKLTAMNCVLISNTVPVKVNIEGEVELHAVNCVGLDMRTGGSLILGGTGDLAVTSEGSDTIQVRHKGDLTITDSVNLTARSSTYSTIAASRNIVIESTGRIDIRGEGASAICPDTGTLKIRAKATNIVARGFDLANGIGALEFTVANAVKLPAGWAVFGSPDIDAADMPVAAELRQVPGKSFYTAYVGDSVAQALTFGPAGSLTIPAVNGAFASVGGVAVPTGTVKVPAGKTSVVTWEPRGGHVITSGETEAIVMDGPKTAKAPQVVYGGPGSKDDPWTVGPEDDPDSTIAWVDEKDNTVYFEPPRGTVSRTGLETVTNAMGGASFPVGLVSADGTATNDLVMVIGASGAKYDSLEEALKAGEDACTLYDVDGCVVNYDGMGAMGEMLSDTFLPDIPTNLTANAYTAFGYEFQGWTTNFGSEVIFADRALIANPKAGDVYDLQAVWKNAPVPVGDGVSAYLDMHGALHIVGAGAMKDFTEDDPAPWTQYASQVKSIEIGGGVTNVGNAAFAALDYKTTTETFVVLDGAHELNTFAFVSADGTVTNAPAIEAFRVFNPESGAEPIEAFYSEATEAFYDSVSGALSAGETALRLVTLEDVKDIFREGLIEAAGEKPYSKAMQELLGQAFKELDAAKTLADAAGVADKYAAPIQKQATLDKVKGEVESEIAKEAGPQPWTENVEAAVTEAVRKIDKATTEEAIRKAGADGIAAVKAAKAEDEKDSDLGGTIPGSDVTWKLAGDQLILDGTGEMPDLTAATVPWSNSVEKTTTVVVGDGVTGLSKGLFTSELTKPATTVLFESAETWVPLTAFVSADGTKTNDAAAVLFGTDADGTYAEPYAWIGEGGDLYESYAEALAAGEQAVKPSFAAPAGAAEEQIEKAPAAILENVPAFDENTGRFTTDPEGNLIAVYATVENVNTNDVETSERIAVRGVAGLADAARLEAAESVGVTVLSLTVDAMQPDAEDEAQQALVDVMTNGLDSAEGFAAKFAEITLATNDVPVTEAKAVIQLHIPYGTSGREDFTVTRIHGGRVEKFMQIPAPAATPADGTFMVGKNELVVWTMRFSLYAIGSTGAGMLDPSALGEVKYPKTPKVKGVPQEFLKEKSTAAWTAKPYDACVFAGWVWTNGTPAAAFELLSENERRNKTLRLKIAAGEQVRPTDVGAVWARIDEDLLGEVMLTPAALLTESKSYVTASVSGLPSGLKFNAKTLAIEWSGKKAPKDAVGKKVKVSVKNASGYTFKQTFLVTVSGGEIARVVPVDDQVRTGVPLMLWCDPAMGTVKKSGVHALGKDGTKKVQISATAAKNYVFAGWYLDPTFTTPAYDYSLPYNNKDYRQSSQTIVMTGPTYLFARFVEKSAKSDPIMDFKYTGAGYCGGSTTAEVETWYQGVSLPTNGCAVSFDSASYPMVSVSGRIPSGVKFDKATLRFTGAPTVCSTDKKPFFTVKVTVKNKSTVSVLTKNIEVKPLPAWAVGNFDGYHVDEGVTNGTFAATVGKTGKVSGKTKGGLADTTFSAKNFSEVFTLDGTNLIYAVDVTVSYKDPVTKKTVKATDTLYLMEDGGTKLGVIGGGDRDGCGSVGVQRAWDRKDLAYPAFDTKALKYPLPLDNGITLKFGAKGKVTVGGTINGVKVSGSTYVLPIEWLGPTCLRTQVYVYVAPKANFADGVSEVYDVYLTTNADGKFAVASFTPPEP